MKKNKKIIFRIRYELYEYLIMSFEFINVSTTCQNTINDTLKEHLNIFVIAYLNDIFIYFKDLKNHKKHVKTILQCLNKKKFLIKFEKCEFHQQEVDFLEFKIEIIKIEIDLDKLNSIKN